MKLYRYYMVYNFIVEDQEGWGCLEFHSNEPITEFSQVMGAAEAIRDANHFEIVIITFWKILLVALRSVFLF